MRRDAFSQYHPLTNFLFFVGAIGCGVFIQHPMYILAACVSSALYVLLLSRRKGVGLVVAMLPVFVMISVINPLFNLYGDTVLFSLFGRPYTMEALMYGMAIGGMFVAMILWFFCYSAVLTSDKFVSLFGSLIPSLSLILVMILRMIPNLMRKTSQIICARKAVGKGAGEQSKDREKVADGMHIMSALTDWALEGSIITADSMRSRGYGSARRTSFGVYRFTYRDGVLIAIMSLLVGYVLLAGGMDAVYSPAVEIAPLSFGYISYCIFLLIPVILQMKEEVLWHISISKI